MAADPAMTRLLLGMGLRQFSMHPAQLLEVKQEILLSDVSRCRAITNSALAETEPKHIRALITELGAAA
jgi:phosphotransferase system enzyme I (PtsI)